MTSILIAEDSPVMAQLLKRLFELEPDLQVVGIARNGEDAVRMAQEMTPDIITMDVIMPRLDGVEATRRIMSETPTPIVMISSHVNDKEMQITFRSLAAGALSVLEKPEDVFAPEFEKRKRAFLATIREMSKLKVKRRVPRGERTAVKAPEKTSAPASPPIPKSVLINRNFQLLAIGSSTGGPQALKSLFSGLPADFPLPIVVAQHITRGFTKGLVDWLGKVCPFKTKMAENREICQTGTIYFAPDGRDMELTREGYEFRLRLTDELPENKLAPSVNTLFHSLAQKDCSTVICGILTGMGSDGADGMLAARLRNAYTFAEAEESCVVYGMPKAAIANDATNLALHLDAMPGHLTKLMRETRRGAA